jgi:hypothetical protein
VAHGDEGEAQARALEPEEFLGDEGFGEPRIAFEDDREDL